jgi:hypothetical protein
MRVRVEPTGPDIRVVFVIVAVGAAMILAISALRAMPADQRPAAPLNVPTVAPGATHAPVSPATGAPAPAGDTTTSAAPRTFTPAESPIPAGTSEPGAKTPYLIPPPGLPHN